MSPLTRKRLISAAQADGFKFSCGNSLAARVEHPAPRNWGATSWPRLFQDPGDGYVRGNEHYCAVRGLTGINALRAGSCEHQPPDRLVQLSAGEGSEREQRISCDALRPIAATSGSSTSRAKLIQKIRRLNQVTGLGSIGKPMINRTEQLSAFAS